MTNPTIQAVTIVGHDSDGNAGMPVDLHAFFANDVYGHGILTAAISGNSHGIASSQVMPQEFITEQFKVLSEDFDIKAARTGMLANDDAINVVADNYLPEHFGPLVVDPVIITKHGAMLLEQSAYELFRERVILLATVITPNFYETQKLTGIEMSTDEKWVKTAHYLQDLEAKNVVIKGAHNDDGQTIVDDFVLLEGGDSFWLRKPFVKTDRLNRTGDSLSTIVAAEFAKGNNVKIAVTKTKDAVHAAIVNPLTVGHKFGPINHWDVQRELH